MASNSLIPPYIQTNANNLSYGLGGEVPPEIALEEQALNRKQQIANLLFQRGMQSPQGQMAGRFYVAPNPMQGVAQLANVLAGGYITHRNDEARKGLAEKNRSMTADAIQAYMQKTSPQPVEQEAFGPGAPVEHPYSIGGEMSVQGMFPGADPRTLPHTFDIDELQPPTPQPVTYRRDNGNMPMWAGPYEGSDSDGYKSPFQQIPEGLSKIAQAFMPEQKAAQTGPRPYDEGPMVFAPWSEQGVTRTEGPRPTNTVMQPPTADSKRQALIEAMTSQIPGLRQFATLQSQQDMAQQEHEAQRGFLAQEKELDRTVRREGIASNEGIRLEQMKQNATLMQMQIDERMRRGENADDLKRELVQTKAEIDRAAQARDADLKRELAEGKNQTLKEIAELKAGATANKPMSPTALRLQQEELDAIGSASSVNADLSAIEQQIDSGKLKLGLAENTISRGKNYLGLGDENSRNFSSFKATLETQRNNSLRLNKGVQTEGDAVRAWNELMENLNDPGVVKQRLQEIQRINQRAIGIRKANIETLRQEYHKEPMDFSQYESQSPAVGQGGAGTLSKEEQSELERLRKKYGR